MTLPSTIEELTNFVIVGSEVVKAWKQKLNAVNKIETTKEARDQVLEDGQKVGSLVLYAEAKLGELLEQTVKERGNITLGSHGRTKSLPEGINKKFSYYAQELHRNQDFIDKALEIAQKRETIATRHDVLKMIKEQKRGVKIQRQREEIQTGIKQPTGFFDIIVIDPPWEYGRKYDADGSRVSSPYPEISFEELKQIELPSKDDCILWLWTTHQWIWDAKQLLDYWGFEYKNILTWDKEKMGIGKWLRLQCEFCLLGIKGNPLWEEHDIRDIIREARREHSRKPDGFYNMIDENFIGEKLDYFGREQKEGWVIFGTGDIKCH